MIVVKVIVSALLVLGLLYWLRTAWGVVRLRSLPDLDALTPPAPARRPKLSVVIAACNEADKIAPAVETLLAADYPNLEIVLVDDRSTDATGEIVDQLATRNSRVTALHVAELPAGWLGKVHALHTGVAAARGQFVLFTDADVHFKPAVLSKAVAYCLDAGVDHLVACPSVWPAGLVVDSLIAAFLRQFLTIVLPPWRVNAGSPGAFFGVGAFNLVRRSAFDATEGFEWLRMETADDAGLGMMMHRSGATTRVVTAFDGVGLHWYRSTAEAMRGAEKAFASAGRCSAVRMCLIALVGLLLETSPLPAAAAIFLGPPWMVLLAASVLIWFVFSTVSLTRWARGRYLPALLAPLVAPISAVAAFRAAWLGWRRGGMMWRGTLYKSADLRAGTRIRLG